LWSKFKNFHIAELLLGSLAEEARKLEKEAKIIKKIGKQSELGGKDVSYIVQNMGEFEYRRKKVSIHR